MKILALVYMTIALVIPQSCSMRNDKVFSASDELHYIVLYENGHDFELLYNGVNTAKGTYSFTSDTILLTYSKNQFEEFDANKVLTRKILVDRKEKRVSSLDNRHFCANIEFDKRRVEN